MSVFHRVDDIDEMPVAELVPRMVRLVRYGGAVAFAFQQGSSAPAENRPATPKAELADISEAMTRDPLFMNLGTIAKVPPPSD